MRNNNSKNLIIAGIFMILVLCVSIGYAYLTKKLTINGVTDINKTSFIIYFDDAKESKGSVEATKELTIDEQKTTIDFGMTLNKPGDFYEFEVSTVNDGTMDVMIDTVETLGMNEENEKYITYTATYLDGSQIKKCDLLASNTRERIKVRVEYKDIDNKEDLPTTDIDLNLELQLNYVQADGCAGPPVIKRAVHIDPNGGIYNGTTEITSIGKNPGEQVEIGLPSRSAYTFVRWELEDGSILEGNTITLENKDVTIKAIWEVSSEVVARIKENYYLTIGDAIEAAVANDTIYLIKDTTESPNNTKQVTLDLQGHTVTGSLTNNGNLTIISTLDNELERKEDGVGTIENPSGTTLINNGTLTLGINDEKVEIENIAIIASVSSTALEQKGTFNFYDGYLEGKIGLNGGYNDTPVYRELENGEKKYYYPFVDRNPTKNCQKVYLSTADRAVVKEITENQNEVYYYNLQDAINTAVVTGYEIYAIRDFEAAYELRIEENQSVVFDIQGYNIETGNDIINSGTLSLKDTGEQKGTLKQSIAITNNGTLNINEVRIEQTTPANIIDNSGTINITKSTLTAKDGYAIYNRIGTTLTFDESTNLNSNKYALYNNSTEELIINGGNIKGIYNDGILTIAKGTITYGNAYSIDNRKKLTINGGTIENGNTAIRGGNITINGGEINASTGISDGQVTVNGGSIKGSLSQIGESIINNGEIIADNDAIVTNGYGTLIINGGTIISKNGTGIDAKAGKLIINNGTIEAKRTGVYGSQRCGTFDCNYPNITINGGSIYGEINGLSSSSRSTIKVIGGMIVGGLYGISNYTNLTIGEKDEEVNIVTPNIIGELYGIYNNNNANVYFYDGILKGKTAGYNESSISAIEDGTKIFTSTEMIEEEEYQINYLIAEENYLRVDGIEYNSFAKAINAITNEGTITVIKSIPVGEEVIIPEGKDITLDLNNFELQFSATITNNGILTIDDTSEEKKGKINNNTTDTITNKKKLEINNGIIQATAQNSSSITNGYQGEVTVNGGQINAASTGISGTSGSITMTGGVIKAKSRGIYISSGSLNMSGGEIHVENTDNTEVEGIKVSGGNATITGGTIEAIAKGNTYGIYFSSGNLNINGDVTIKAISETGTGIGIYNYSNSEIKSGNIYGSTYGIQGVGGTITIGEKGGKVNTSNPVIRGESYGIYNNNNYSVYLYDGILKGQEAGYFGTITGIEDGTKIYKGKEIIEDVEYETTYLEAKENFVKVGETEYNSIMTAINSIEQSGTITVIASTLVEEVVIFPKGKDITLDLNNQELQFNATITNNGTLTIDDTSEEKKGKIINNSSNTYAITNNKKLEINNGMIQATSATIYNYVEVIVNGGVINASTGIKSRNNSITTMTGGVINATYTGIDASYGNLNMSGGEIHVEGNSTATGIHVNGYGVNIIITGGTIEAKSISNWAAGVFSEANGNLSINDNVTIKGTSETNTGYGIVSSSISKIKSGNIYGSTYGIQLRGGNITIGEKDEKVSIATPNIIGGLYGLYNNNNNYIVYFYDGILKGKTAGYYGAINEIEEGTLIKEDTENIDEEEYIVNYLIKEDYIVVNETTSTQYKNLQTAINEASNKDTIKFISDASLYYEVTIEDKKITLDLDGHELYTTKGITNKGNLTIKSEAENAIIKTVVAINLLVNEGTLNINNTNLSISTWNSIIYNNKNGNVTLENVSTNGSGRITNTSGIVTLNDTNINSTAQQAIENNANLKVNGGSIKGYLYAVYLSSSSENSTYENTTIEGQFYKNSASETTVSNSTLAHVSLNSGTTNLTDNTIEYLYNSGTANVNGGTINGVISNSGNMTLEGVSISNTEPSEYVYNDAVLVSNSGNLEINNTQIELAFSYYYRGNIIAINNQNTLNINNSTITLSGNGCNNTLYGIYNQRTSNTTLNNSSVIINNAKEGTSPTNTSYGIYSQDANSKTTILNGEIINASSSTSYGIYINNGEVEIGEKEATDSPNYGTAFASVSTESPLIKAIGTTTGIGVKKVSGYYKFYDGKIIGSTEASPATTSEAEYNYEVTKYQEDEYEYAILEYIKAKSIEETTD